MRDEARVLQALVELFEVPLEIAEAEPVGCGAFGADGGAPNLVEGAYALLGARVGSSDGGLKGVEGGPSAFEGDAV